MKKLTFFTVILLNATMALQGQWSYSNLSEPKAYMGATALGNKAYFAGGDNGYGMFNEVEVYDDTSGWSIINELSVARDLPFATACGSKLFFAGGADFYGSGAVYSTVDIYDTLTHIWSVKELSVPRLQAAVVSHGNKVLFAGGANLQQQSSYAIVDIYNVEADEWTTASLSEPRTTWWAVVGDLAIFAGGFDFPEVSKRVDIYNFTTDTWSIDSLSVARAFVGMTTLGDKVLIAGGMTADNMRSDVADIYDSQSGTWDTAYLSLPRAFCDNQNAVTAGGKAYFVGGGNLDLNTVGWTAAYNVVDIYNEIYNDWSIDYLSQSLVHRAVVSLGDKFLVAGGVSINPINYSSSVEIYTCPPSSCLPTGIIFSSQEDIDNFQINHPTCNEVLGSVIVTGTGIHNLSGLSVLTSIGGNLTIYNTSLENLAGLDSVTFIGGNLSIGMQMMGCTGNDSLTILSGLDSLKSVGGNLNIVCNEILSDLSGLENLDTIGGSLSIIENSSLSACDIQSICHHLASPNGASDIHDNMIGCNSPEEVEAACAGVGIESSVVSHQSSVVCYPNPTQGIVDFRLSMVDGRWVSLKVYDVTGKEVEVVLEGKWSGDQVVRWDAGGLPAGVYYYQLRAKGVGQVGAGKIVKY